MQCIFVLNKHANRRTFHQAGLGLGLHDTCCQVNANSMRFISRTIYTPKTVRARGNYFWCKWYEK